jgi:hypothetical protein
MAGPTTEVLAEDLKELARAVGELRTEFGEFRSEVRTGLGVIKWVGVFFAGILVSLVTGTIGMAWNASAVVSDVRQHGERLDKVEKRLDGIESKLDVLIRRTEPKAGG